MKNSLFKNHDLTINTKMRLLRCYVFSVLFYGVEYWTLTEATIKELETFEMWLYRRILSISWTAQYVLRKMKKEREEMCIRDRYFAYKHCI